MLIRILCLFGVVAVLTTTAALPSPHGGNLSQQTTQMVHHQTGKFHLPRELKIVWRQEEHARLKGMPKEQRHGWLKRQWAAMSMNEKQHKIAELQAKWNRLPADVRQAMLQKREQRREARRMQKAEVGSSGQMSTRHTQ